MPQYLSPGVYVEEKPSTPPIVGVGTSTAAFIGVAPENVAATENTATLVTNWEQFKTKFGDFQTGNSILAHAVYGFFNNGGTTCYVARVKSLVDPTNVKNVGDALRSFEPIDAIAIVAIPGCTNKDVLLALVNHCEKLKDRFAILDGKQAKNDVKPESIMVDGVGNSQYAALYFPWLQVYDPVTKTSDGFFVPPSGHIAGLYARVDQERGVHKAPANEVVRGALGLEYAVTKGEQDLLNPAGINVIRSINGNIKVWGARTLGGNSNGEYKYINVRRLMNFIEESIDECTQFVVFEPNNKALWQRINRSIRGFLTNIWRDGALFGDTAEQAFYVKCDESTNPPDIRELGQVVTEIGVAIVKPAEFVIFRISQITLPS